MRTAEVVRNTKETQIRVKLDLDGRGLAKLSTGLPFLEHMLDQVARHGMLDLEIDAKGDLHIDAHHTVEDVGLTLGEALRRALGEKTGIRRFGEATVPLDEALVSVVVDLSGRPYLAYNVKLAQERVGSFDVGVTGSRMPGSVPGPAFRKNVCGTAGGSMDTGVENVATSSVFTEKLAAATTVTPNRVDNTANATRRRIRRQPPGPSESVTRSTAAAPACSGAVSYS